MRRSIGEKDDIIELGLRKVEKQVLPLNPEEVLTYKGGGVMKRAQIQMEALKLEEIQELRAFGRKKRIVLEYQTSDRLNHVHDLLRRLTGTPAYASGARG